MVAPQLSVYATCPEFNRDRPSDYIRRVQDVAVWSERYGCCGMLINSDNTKVDPWLLAQHVLTNTAELSPAVSVQPMYMHPYAAAKMVASLSLMFQRRIELNLIAGGLKNDLVAFNEDLSHDERYARLGEYATVMQRLLWFDEAVTFHGRYYHITNLRLFPSLAAELLPQLMMPATSRAAAALCNQLGALSVGYNVECADSLPEPVPRGQRVGLIVRATDSEAWQAARMRFPADRQGRTLHRFARSVSDSHGYLRLADSADITDRVVWMQPLRTCQAYCPY